MTEWSIYLLAFPSMNSYYFADALALGVGRCLGAGGMTPVVKSPPTPVSMAVFCNRLLFPIDDRHGNTVTILNSRN